MRKFIVILAIIFLAATCLADGVKMIGRDFWVNDQDVKPLSFGLCSWTDKDTDLQLAGYFNCSLFNFWDNHLRFGVGCAVTSPDVDTVSKVDARLMTTATTLFFKHLEIGFYAAPFYNAVNNSKDDPYGFMMGYAFWF